MDATPSRCEDCGVTPPLDVYPSRSGWYVGAWCACGPLSRESDYFADFDAAEAVLFAPAQPSVPAVRTFGLQLELFATAVAPVALVKPYAPGTCASCGAEGPVRSDDEHAGAGPVCESCWIDSVTAEAA